MGTAVLAQDTAVMGQEHQGAEHRARRASQEVGGAVRATRSEASPGQNEQVYREGPPATEMPLPGGGEGYKEEVATSFPSQLGQRPGLGRDLGKAGERCLCVARTQTPWGSGPGLCTGRKRGQSSLCQEGAPQDSCWPGGPHAFLSRAAACNQGQDLEAAFTSLSPWGGGSAHPA